MAEWLVIYFLKVFLKLGSGAGEGILHDAIIA
jgi:hypothetical protein